MIELYNFDSWPEVPGLSEGSGASEKRWLQSPSDPKLERGLFKFPKLQKYSDGSSGITAEHISEWLAAQLGAVVGIPCAEVDLGYRGGRIGSFSHLITGPKEALVEGVNFIREKYPRYNAKDMIDEADGTHYCLGHILESTQDYSSAQNWIEMLMFDFLIGNADRHQSNWALLRDENQKYRRCPLYDNGSSLCCYVEEKNLDRYFSKDKRPMEAQADSKSRSQIRIDGTVKRKPTHREVVGHVFETYPRIAVPISYGFLNSLTQKRISGLLAQLPDDICSSRRKELITCFLDRKLEILRSFL